MKKGRGLVEQSLYDELVKVPGIARLLIANVTNFRVNPKTGKVCAEIHEDAWPDHTKTKFGLMFFENVWAGKTVIRRFHMPENLVQLQGVATKLT